MKTRMMILMGALLFALATLAFGASTAAAAGRGPGVGNGTAPATGYGPGAHGQGWGGADASLVAVAAEQLGMTQTDLVAALQGGQTIGQVADAHNVARTAIVDAFLAPRAAALADRVSAGRLTQAQADQMLATMRTQVTARLDAPWTPRGAGAGTGTPAGTGTCDGTGPHGYGNR